jgi:exosortase A-associated hydrolase 2
VSRSVVSAQFIAGAKGSNFLLLRRPPEAPRGCVLVVPPFAEEMNKSRRMITEVACALASRGIASIVPDLYGTGDSGGDFADADWDTWLDDLVRASRWSASEGHPVSGLLAVRLGCALASALVSSQAIAPVSVSVLWQPVFDGRRFLTQFLRLRVAAALVESDRKEDMTSLLEQLRRGEVVEVAGYGLAGALATQLERVASPAVLPGALGRIHWMEVVREQASLPVPAAQLIERSLGAGVGVASQLFTGEPFWAATEIVTNEAMVAATVAAFA